MKINLNARVRVTLTEHGKDRLRRNRAELGLRDTEPSEKELSGHFQLWELCHEFGPDMYNGSQRLPFVNNEIEFDAEEW